MSQYQVPDFLDGSVTLTEIERKLGIGYEESYLLCNGRVVPRTQPLQAGKVYYILPRVMGGKGGFGSMLRAIGAQIEKTTSREACRDLSGRRIRDINNEKKLKEWVAKQASREQEKEEREERRRAKRAKYLDDTPPKMNNPEYTEQYSQIMKQSEQALQQGLAKLKEGQTSSRKRKAESSTGGSLDKYNRWSITGGMTIDDLDSDSDAGTEEGGSHPNPSLSHPDQDSSSSSSSQESTVSKNPTKCSSPSATVTSSSAASTHLDDGLACQNACLGSSRSNGEPAVAISESCEASRNGTDVPEAAEKQSQDKSDEVPVSEQSTEPIDLEQFTSSEDLENVGMEHLKADLMRRGMKCGGSISERAHRLFSIKGLSAEQIPAKLLAKGKGQGKKTKAGNNDS